MLSSACIYLATVKLFARCFGALTFLCKSQLKLNEFDYSASAVPSTPLIKPSTEDKSKLPPKLEKRVADTRLTEIHSVHRRNLTSQTLHHKRRHRVTHISGPLSVPSHSIDASTGPAASEARDTCRRETESSVDRYSSFMVATEHSITVRTSCMKYVSWVGRVGTQSTSTWTHP